MSFLLVPALMLLGFASAQEERPGTVEGAPVPSEPQPAEGLQAVQVPGAQERRLESLFEGALVGVQDAQDFAETPGYRLLLDRLSHYGEKELQQKAGRRLDVAAALADPGAWRGEIVRLRGLVADMGAVRLAQPLGDHVDVWRAYVAEADGTEGVAVDFLEPPPELELQNDVVDVEGVFFRTVRYEDRKGEYFSAPYLIARNLRRTPPEALQRSTALDGTIKIVILVAVGYLVIRILNTMRKGPAARQPRDSIEARAARNRRRSERALVQPEPPAQKS